MLGFVGQFQHSLDAKGRLILPAKFRAEYEHGGHLSPNTDGCVALRTPGEFARQAEERLAQARHGGADELRVARYWAANSSDAEFDKQGRFALPTSIREYAQLEGDVLGKKAGVDFIFQRIELLHGCLLDFRVVDANKHCLIALFKKIGS